MEADPADVPSELRRVLDKKRKRANRIDERTGVRHATLHTAICIGLLCGCDMRAGAAWLESRRRRGSRVHDDLSADDVLHRLRDFFIEADLDFLDALRDPDQTSLSASAFDTASRAAEDFKLANWVRQQNLAGNAIRTSRLIEMYTEQLHTHPPPVPPKSQPTHTDNMGRLWAHRWRATQGAVFGKLRTEEDITVEEKRLKVGPSPPKLDVQKLLSGRPRVHG